MRTTHVLIFLCLGLMATAFIYPKGNTKTATVSQTEGIYLFVGSTPVDEYESLGRVKQPGVATSTKWDNAKKVMLKRIKEQHPTADAAILSNLGDLWEWEAIKLK